MWGTPRDPIAPTFAGGEATLSAIAESSWRALWYVGNSNARDAALEDAYDTRIAAVKRETGIELDNPIRSVRDAPPEGSGFASFYESADAMTRRQAEAEARFADRLAEIASERPDKAEAIGAGRPVLDDARQLARGAEEDQKRLMGSRPGPGKYLAAFGGGLAGALRDPLQSILLLAGGGPGAARTVAGRILTTALSEGAVNAAGEAVLQPIEQGWRAEVGLDHGLPQALEAIGFAALLGAGLGGGGRAIAEGVRAAVTRAAGRPFEALPGELRGAVAALEDEAAITAMAPEGLAPAAHDRAIAAATAAAERPDTMAEAVSEIRASIAEGDDAPILLKPRRAPVRRGPQSLFDLVADLGGLRDEAGELATMGLDRVFVPGRGRIVRAKGRDLDSAREAAAEAGYFPEFGTNEEAVARTTVADFLDALDREARGQRIYSIADQDERIAQTEARRRASLNEQAEARLAGFDAQFRDVPDFDIGTIDRETRLRAAALVEDEGLDPESALERVAFEDYYRRGDDDPQTLAEVIEVPFFDDEAHFRPDATGGDGFPGDRLDEGRPREGEPPDDRGPPRSAGDAEGEAGRPLPDAVLTLGERAELEPFEPGPAAAAQTEALLGALDEAPDLDAVMARFLADAPDAAARAARADRRDVIDIGPFGPVYEARDYRAAVERLRAVQGGEVRGVLAHAELGPIDLPWGWFDRERDSGAGLAKIIDKHPEMVDRLPAVLAAGKATIGRTRATVDVADARAVIRLDFDGEGKTWLFTAYEKRGEGRRAEGSPESLDSRPADSHSSSAAPAEPNIGKDALGSEPDPFGPARLEIENEPIPLGDGQTLADALADARHVDGLAGLVDACRVIS